MLTPLSASAHRWAQQTFATMTLEEKIGHLLCPEERDYSVADWETIFREVPLGSIFMGYPNPQKSLEALEAIQKWSRIPVLVASDLEHGAGAMISGAVNYPFPMGVAAAALADDDPAVLHSMGRVTAREGRAWGCHWTFSPVVDLNINAENPVTNIRSLGDDPDTVAAHATALIAGLQESGELAATAKHFPGDGVDDRDQHLCTSVNKFSTAKWWKTYGKVWRAAIRAGAWSVMVGHIAFPAYEGLPERQAMPATLSAKLQVELLRGKLGFRGLIVSDAAPMVGISSRVRADEKALQNILTGSDVYLFADPRRDFARLMSAAQTGRLSLSQVDASVMRVLELKARLGLHLSTIGPALTADERLRFEADAQNAAEKAITRLRADTNTPLKLAPGAKVLTVTLRHDNKSAGHEALPQVDEELRQRGYAVTHIERPSHTQLVEISEQFDAVFVNIITYPHQEMGTMRMTAGMAMPLWESFWPSHASVIFTSFGSPYIGYELPHVPNLYVTYGAAKACQMAAVKAWLGEIPAKGVCPVQLSS
jgi:beta-N-acetylhexosaminidase